MLYVVLGQTCNIDTLAEPHDDYPKCRISLRWSRNEGINGAVSLVWVKISSHRLVQCSAFTCIDPARAIIYRQATKPRKAVAWVMTSSSAKQGNILVPVT